MAFDITGTESHSNWVKDGTAVDTPVTESTPNLTADPGAAELSDSKGSAGASPAPSAGQADTLPSGSAATEPAGGQATTDFLEALLDGKPFQIPKGVQLPWKRGTETGHAPLEEILKSSMLERDYRVKTAETARMRREYEDYLGRLRAEDARMSAMRSEIEAERERIRKSTTDPDELQRLADHYDRLSRDPAYKKYVEDALRARSSEAELAAVREQEMERISAEAVPEILSAIKTIVSAEFPGVDPDVVRERYAQALVEGKANLSEDAIRHFASQEAQTASRYVAPLRSELETMRAELADLRKMKEKVAAAEAHNAQTQHALERSKAPKTGPTGGGTPAPKERSPRKPYTSDTLPDVLREWSRAGTK